MYFIDDLFNRRFFFTRSEQPREIVILINDILIPTCFFPPLKRSLLAHAIFGFDKENFFSVIKKKKKRKHSLFSIGKFPNRKVIALVAI